MEMRTNGFWVMVQVSLDRYLSLYLCEYIPHVGAQCNTNVMRVVRVEYIVTVTVIIVDALFGAIVLLGLYSNEVIKL